MMATSSDTASEASAAHWAFTLSAPMRMKIVINGSAAKSADSASESPIGEKSCWYMDVRLSSEGPETGVTGG